MTETERQDAEAQAAKARQLLAGRLYGVISTLGADRPDQPFGSVAPYCLGYDGAPVFLLSDLAQHAKNLTVNPRAALTLLADFTGDVQQAARLTGEGEILSMGEDSDAAERYFRYFPQARAYHEELGFRFYGLRPQRWHFNSGFATARWFGNDRILRVNPFSGEEEAGIVDHMNADHADALSRYLAGAGKEVSASAAPRLCGVDGEGMDIASGDSIERIAFPRPVDSPEALRDLLVVMART